MQQQQQQQNNPVMKGFIFFFNMLTGKFLHQMTANLKGELNEGPDSSVNYL